MDQETMAKTKGGQCLPEAPMVMFTRQQVLDEVAEIREQKLSITDSKIYSVWRELALDWISNTSDDTYILDGFIGFNQRTANQILLDLHLAGELEDPLSYDEVDLILSEGEN